jgi:SAM-dependent methyltransferase
MTQPTENDRPDAATPPDKVRAQYEQFPYPPRDPDIEKTRFHYSNLCALDTQNQYGWSGKRDFTKGFRALVAGGGTGDATIMLAEQFRGLPADIVHLDVSETSMRIAQRRAEVRRLDNIAWVHGSLLDAGRLVDGAFDYIDCCGVLHHLESPEAGLKSLVALLKEDGVLGAMLYARYGREGVYQIQKLLALLNQGEHDLRKKIDRTQAVLKNLPETSPFKQLESLVAGDLAFGDAGLCDLLLHPVDAPFSVPEVHALLGKCGLTMNHFLFGDWLTAGNDLYRLESYFPDGSLSPEIAALRPENRQAAAELMHGKMIKHVFYASRKPSSSPSVEDVTLVPYMSMWVDAASHRDICEAISTHEVGQEVEINVFRRPVRFTKTVHTDLLLAYLDGTRTTAEIFGQVAAFCAPSDEAALLAEFRTIYEAFNRKDLLYLRDRSVPRVKSIREIQQASMAARGETA